MRNHDKQAADQLGYEQTAALEPPLDPPAAVHAVHRRETLFGYELVGQGVRGAKQTKQKEQLEQAASSKRIKQDDFPTVSFRCHVFYYAWYGSKEKDGQWVHWNHKFLPHWNAAVARRYPDGQHKPDAHDIGSDFMPQLGPYSSTDPHVIDQHMTSMAAAGIGVLVLSWYPPGLQDENGLPSDPMVKPLLDAASRHGLQLCLHVEPYKGRNARTVANDIQYAPENYGNHPAYHRMPRHGSDKPLPVFYIYDSYHTPAQEWATILKPGGSDSIRGTSSDAFVIFLLVEHPHTSYVHAGFDGFYTYFAADGFSYGATTSNWRLLTDLAKSSNTMFIPSVGPGYIDVSVRPWNAETTRGRVNGQYYDRMWTRAMSSQPKVVSITSWNEWHEGTQIEPAVPDSRDSSHRYLDYESLPPDGYLKKTRAWVEKLDPSAVVVA